MPIQLSPGVAVVEKDFTNIVPAIASSACGFAGAFAWGPVLEPTTIISENDLVASFGKPNATAAQSFFTAANFLSYSNNLLNIRTDGALLKNAVATGTATKVRNADHYNSTFSSGTAAVEFAAKYPGILGNSIGVEMADSATFKVAQILGEGTTTTSSASLTGIASSTSVGSVTSYTGNGTSSVTLTGTGLSASVGSQITISGATGAQQVKLNGTWVVTSASAIALTFNVATTVAVGVLTANLGTAVKTASKFSTQLYVGAVIKTAAQSYSDITTTLTGTTLVGVGTLFSTQLYVGAVIKTASGVTIGTVTAITDNTNATITPAAIALTNGAAIVESVVIGTVASITNDSTAVLTANANFAVTGATTLNTAWKYASQFQSAPNTSAFAIKSGAPLANDEIHVLIIDTNGVWTGIPNSILEKYSFLSKALGAKTENGTNNYYKDVLNANSKYVWWMSPIATASGSDAWGTAFALNKVYNSMSGIYSVSLSGGVDDFDPTDGNKMDAYSLLTNNELYDIAYIAAGKASSTVANYLISSIAEVRKDIIVFVSPQDTSDDKPIIGNSSAETAKIIAYRDLLPSSSFGVIDSGYKYQYDRYNDMYQYVPLNGDIAGLCARTDATNDPWFSPGGLNRGQIKNVVKLAYNPNHAARDALYSDGINPVVSFPGQGVVLYGDKTMLSKPSAFDRIGVRRLFIILERSVAEAARYQLFEFNDGFTRAQFKNMIEPFLRDIQGRRGINDFQVVCDSTNNTDQVISSNNFVGDIYIKPNYSINYITLNFIAGRQSVAFSTLGA